MYELPVEPLTQCAFDLAQACQVAVGIVLGFEDWPDFEPLIALFQAAPSPQTYIDAIVASVVLFRFIQHIGPEIHHRIHRESKTSSCEFNPSRYESLSAVDPANFRTWSAGSIFTGWATAYSRAFSAYHPATLTERAKQCVRTSASSSIDAPELARKLGCSVTVLHRQFARSEGDSIRQCRIRGRTCAAFDLLRTTNWKIEVIAAQVGWKSKKDMYAAFRRLLGMTPRQIRALPDDEAAVVRARLAVDRPGTLDLNGDRRIVDVLD
jgi:AraC-like DNA-binding protein